MTRACPVRRGLVAAVTCCVRKTRFVLLPGQVLEQKKNEPEPCVDFSTTRANPVWFSVFRSHDCRPEFQKHPRSTQTDQQQRHNSIEPRAGLHSNKHVGMPVFPLFQLVTTSGLQVNHIAKGNLGTRIIYIHIPSIPSVLSRNVSKVPMSRM